MTNLLYMDEKINTTQSFALLPSFIFLTLLPLPIFDWSGTATEMSEEVRSIALCIFPRPAPVLLSDDKLLSYLSSLQNSLWLLTLIPLPVPPGALFHPCLAWVIFTTVTWPPSASTAYAWNPARRVNLPALIKIASFVLLSLLPSSCPWWHNGAGNFPPQSWLKRTDPWKNWSVLHYFMMT